ncbi:hypothetical protein MAR_011596, partial [Mya arenaria]
EGEVANESCLPGKRGRSPSPIAPAPKRRRANPEPLTPIRRSKRIQEKKEKSLPIVWALPAPKAERRPSNRRGPQVLPSIEKEKMTPTSRAPPAPRPTSHISELTTGHSGMLSETKKVSSDNKRNSLNPKPSRPLQRSSRILK